MKMKGMEEDEDDEIVKVPEERLQRLKMNSNSKSERQIKLKQYFGHSKFGKIVRTINSMPSRNNKNKALWA